MAVGKEIRTKIKSVENTRKITKAMEMVAASKMRKAQDRMLASRPYNDKLSSIISHFAQSKPEYTHPFMQSYDDAKAVGMVVISTDKGLCGGLNTFSTFSIETFELLKNGQFYWAVFNILLSIVLCLLIIYLIYKKAM